MNVGERGMPQTFDERIVPDETDQGIVSVHLKRYEFVRTYCEGKRVLDVACGNGYGTYFLSHVTSHVTGGDRSPKAIAYARKRYPHPRADFRQLDAQSLPFPDAHFDVVCSFETIEHLDRVEDYLSEVVRVLKPTGIFCVSTPFTSNTTTNPKNPFHTQEWSVQDFTNLLSKCFENVQLFGQRRKETWLHRLLTDLDVFKLRFHINNKWLRRTFSSVSQTTAYADLSLSDLEILEDDFKDAEAVIGLASRKGLPS